MSGTPQPETVKGQLGLYRAALFGFCPKCGARTVFEAPAMVAETCTNCDLQLSEYEPSGRLVPLLLTVWVAVLLILAALTLDSFLRPPIWVHLVLWTPLTIGLELFALRVFKIQGLYRAYERMRTAYVQSEPR
ncbi:MAG: DUF983 domain-containing protein [Pseudomonadota bacterium]